MHPSTFSIVAKDFEHGGFGVAVQSRFLAVGSVVPWARAGVGAVATQAMANPAFGPDGLALLAEGKSASEAGALLIERDEGRDNRQLGLVDSAGGAFAYTGKACLDYAGHEVGEGFCCQGNILAGPEVVSAMARAYRETSGDFPDRLLAALEAGQAAGGDRRGKQSAALLVVKAGAGYGGMDRLMDLRVDDHPEPIQELSRIMALHTMVFAQPEPDDVLELTPERRERVQAALRRLGYGDQPFDEALDRFLGTQNFEMRKTPEGTIDRRVLRFLDGQADS